MVIMSFLVCANSIIEHYHFFCTLFFIPQLFYTIITEISLDKKVLLGYNKLRKEDYDKLSVILLYLGEESKNECLGFLQTLFDGRIKEKRKIEVLEKDYGIKMNEELRKEIQEMCNLDEYVAKRGREEGIAQGIEKTTLKSLQSVMNHLQVDLKKAMEILELPVEDFSKYQQLLKH